MLTFDETMDLGAERYRDVLEILAGAGLPATFTQTGGMCAAIEVVLDGGRVLLVTDADDSLSWDRETHLGWGAGLYRPDGDGSYLDDGPLAYDTTDDGSPRALVPLVRSVLLGPTGAS